MDLNMPRMSRAESKARTRDRLLDAARQVFEEKGFHAATVEEIVARAGYTRGAFYANWSDKADVLWELIETHNRDRFAQVATALEVAPVGEKTTVLQDWFESLMGSWPLGRAGAELHSTVGGDEAARARLARMFADERRTMTTVIEAVSDELGVRPPIPVEHMAAMGIALGHGLSLQFEADPGALPFELFSTGQAYLWLGAFAAVDVPEVNPPSGRTTRGPSSSGRRRS